MEDLDDGCREVAYDLSDRRTALEDELGHVRGRLDEQIDDLRKRQAALSEEESLLRRQLQASTEDDSADGSIGQAVEPPKEAEESAAVVETRVEEDAEKETAFDAGLFDDVCADALLTDDAPTDLAEDTVEESLGSPDEDATPSAPETAPAPAGAASKKHEHRFRFWPAVACGLLLGAMTAGAVMWSPSKLGEVRQRWVLSGEAPEAAMGAREHLARVLGDPEVLASASAQARMDMGNLLRLDRVRIATTEAEDALEWVARVEANDRSIGEGWLGALSQAYEASLARSVLSEDERQATLAAVRTQFAERDRRLQAARAELQHMEEALEANGPIKDAKTLQREKADLAGRVGAALAASEEADAALQRFLTTPAPTEPVVPSAAQVEASMAAAPRLSQMLQERSAKARSFHAALTDAMSEAQTPLTSLLANIGRFSREVDAQLDKQTDAEIRRELELVKVDLADYKEQTDAFIESWDLLTPKVARWKPEDPTDLLLEYQEKSETLVRDFHADSRVALASAIKKADEIGRGGKELAMRRIIQNALAKPSHACFEARKEWVRSASGVVPANHLELKALRDTLVKLTQRIEDKRRTHRVEVAAQLTEQRDADREIELQQLRARAEEAADDYRELSRLAMKAADAVIQSNEDAFASIEQRRAEIDAQRGRVVQLDREAAKLAVRVERLEDDEAISLAGALVYGPTEFEPPRQFDLARADVAGGAGGGVAILVVVLFWLLAPRRSVAPASRR